MKKWIVKLIVMLFIIITPIFTIFIITEKTPDQYDKTYLAELDDKFVRLTEDKNKKIVFIGDSAMAFGLRCDLIQKQLPDYKVVNFGLYGALGTKLMLDLSKANIQQGDIYIISPGISEQSYSLYFNAEETLQAFDGFTWKTRFLGWENNKDLFFHYYQFAKKKLDYYNNNNAPDPIGIYRHDSFNEYGDIAIDRPNNIMNNGVDSTHSITTTNKLLDKDFISYVNDYCEYVRNRGAKVYFNFSPCNELAILSSEKTRKEFQLNLDNSITCDLLSNFDDCIIDYRYFYDTNFHLNSSGAIYYTSLIINNLKMKLGLDVNITPSDSNSNDDNQNIIIDIPTIPGEEDSKDKQDIVIVVPETSDKEEEKSDSEIIVPTPPTIDEDEVDEPIDTDEKIDFDLYNGEPNNDYLDYFEYRLVGSSYQITKIKDECKNVEKIILPSTYNGKNITTLTSNALYGCINLKECYVSQTYKVFEENAFNGCISLDKIYFFQLDGNKLTPSSTGLLNGTSKNIKIYIPEGANYLSGYTWSNYASYFVYFKRGE